MKSIWKLMFTVVVLFSFFGSLLSRAADMKPEDVVAKHLDSIGDTKARSAAKARVAQGTAEYKILVGGNGTLDGKAILVSQDRKLQLMMKFPNNLYHGEQFIFDGDKVQVSGSTANQGRSPLGEFVRVQDAVLREGLLGGTLSTAWPLADLSDRKAKVSYEGMKKIDGKDLIDLKYKPKKNSDMDIHMYFDPETYHHVLTVYTVTIQAAGLGNIDAQVSSAQGTPDAYGVTPTGGIVTDSSETLSARQQRTRFRLEERFSDYKTVDGLTLPSHYLIHFSQELQNGKTTVADWDITTSTVENPPGVDPRNFVVK